MESFDVNPETPKSDSLSCGALAVDLIDPEKIYVGTGEGVFFGYFGVGPIVSSDGGQSWAAEPTAPESPTLEGSRFYALAVDPDPDHPGRVVAATLEGLYRREPDGVGGFLWAKRHPDDASQDAKMTSVVAARTGTTTTFYASGEQKPVFASTDGETWHVVGTGFPEDNVGRVGLAVQSANPRVLYALVARRDDEKLHGVYRLDLAEGIWREVLGVPADLLGISGTWGVGAHALAIAVDPVDVNRIYVGGSGVLAANADTGQVEVCGAVYRCAVTVSGTTVRATPVHIGATVHADILTLVFAPNDPNTLWVGCDGGAFVSANPTATRTVFQARNTGLATLQMHHLGQHPSEDAVLFCGTQDNGGVRFTGEEAWLYSAGGESGYFVINWDDPYRVLNTYLEKVVRLSTDGGDRYSDVEVKVPLQQDERILFYPPLVGTPRNGTAPAEAEIVAFGSIRPWISSRFGGPESDDAEPGFGDWHSIPNGTLAADSLDAEIRSLAFASAKILYAGTMGGGVYRFVRTGTRWKRTQLDSVGGGDALPLQGPVTDIAIDPADSSGNSIYITFGGNGDFLLGDYRHVWHFNGTRWQQRSGPQADALARLLDVQVNAIAVDPANPSHLYVGADIGIWRSTDSGGTWSTFSRGLPDVAVIDLALHHDRRLLRASTHGRSVYECRLDATSATAVELYVRDTQLDQGRFVSVDGSPDPIKPGRTVSHWAGPDIRLDTPDGAGQYRLPISPPAIIDFLDFTDTLTEDFRKVPTYATETVTTRVYVQVHNRGVGVRSADNVQVMLLVANAPASLPALPSGFAASVRNGTPINTPDWQTVGFATLDGVRPGVPKIAAFDLTADKLPAPDQPASDNHHCVLALVHHADDPFTATQTVGDLLSLTDRKAAHKHLKALQFVGMWQAPPPESVGMWKAPPPAILRVRLNNANADRELLTDLVVELGDVYSSNPDEEVRRGRVRVVLPPLHLDGHLEQHLEGLRRTDDNGDFKFKEWAQQQRELLDNDQHSSHPHNKVFVRQQIDEIDRILAHDMLLLLADDDATRLAVRRIKMAPGNSHTLFLLFDRPTYPDPHWELGPGRAFNVDVMQLDTDQGTVLGGLSSRIELAWPSMYYPE
jgi:hypothetical protein